VRAAEAEAHLRELLALRRCEHARDLGVCRFEIAAHPLMMPVDDRLDLLSLRVGEIEAVVEVTHERACDGRRSAATSVVQEQVMRGRATDEARAERQHEHDRCDDGGLSR
jgi:hypothetical protein